MKAKIVTTLISICLFMHYNPVFGQTPQSGNNNNKFFEIKYEDLLKHENLIRLSQIASKVEYIQLETNSDCLISATAKYYCLDSLIFVCERDHILKFSSSGRFLKKIGQPGKGPGEIYSIKMLSILPRQSMLVVHDAVMKKMTYFSFDGELVKTVSVPPLSYIKVMNDGLYIAFDQGSSQSEKYTFRLSNEAGDTLSVIKNYLPWKNPSGFGSMIVIPNLEPFYFYQNRYFFKAIYNDTVYAVNGNGIIPSYFINLGKYKLPEEGRMERLSLPVDDSFKKNLTKYYYATVLEAGGKIFLKTRNWGNGSALYFLINKKELMGNLKSSYPEISTDFIANDWDGGMYFWPVGSINDDKVFMPIDVIRLKKFLELRSSIKTPIRFPEKQNELEKITSNLDIASNPIIMLVTLKTEI